MNIKLGFVGAGIVGHASARAFIEHVAEVRVYDVVRERATHSLDDVLACDLVMLCLPTPQYPDRLECDVSAITNFFAALPDEARTRNYVIRSTVPVGATRKWSELQKIPNLCHSPEFLTARCAVTDAQLPARNIVGDPHPATFNSAAKILEGLYRLRFPGVPCIVCSSDESEAVKLFQNSFFAVKIAFWNECHAYATKMGLNWDVVLGAVLLDGRISHSHTKVPGPDGRFGAGGACLPKDIANLTDCMQRAGVPVGDGKHWCHPHILRAAIERNAVDRERVA